LRPRPDARADADPQTQAFARLLAQVMQDAGGAGGGGGAEALAELLATLAPSQGIDQQCVANRTGTMTFQAPQDAGEAADASRSSDDERKCMVCLESFAPGEELRILPCLHRYHLGCIDPWLAVNRHCPICKHDVTQ